MKLTGWRALGAALVAGALAALAMPPLYWLPLAIAGIVAYVWLWQTAPTPLSAFWRGLAWGTGHFVVGSYWILEAFYVPPADFALLGPPIVAGLAVVLGFFPGLAAWASRRIVDRWPSLGGRYSRLVVLAIAWTVAEWLRGHLFTGYPWNPLAHVWAFATPLLQGAALFGVYGLGMLTFLVLAAPTAGWRASIAALVAVGLAGWAGQSAMAAIENGNGPWIRIVQPNVAQAQKYRPEARARQIPKLVEMSRQPGFDRLAAVVWPETAPPDIIEPGSAALALMAQAVPPGGLLLTGAARATAAGPQDGVWNSLLVVDGAGTIAAHYDKVHLVPLGEYIPFHKQLAPVSGMIGRGSFEVGEGRVTLVPTNGLPSFSPIICYEVIFPAAVTGPGQRPQWLLNITNDAWFGLSSGPYQHLTSARLRTIEEGLPMIRAANTGVSAVIDAYGRVLASLDMLQEGIIDHRLPAPRVATPYARWGDWTLLVVVAFLGVTLIGTRLWKSRQPQ
ncbi:apolipoprotein N-acyltransferase [Rhodospirillales bacterium URHD0017]|nr:apolipoprotein N-acyltransferase [Rhodospirillales bacterium URHD0017]